MRPSSSVRCRQPSSAAAASSSSSSAMASRQAAGRGAAVAAAGCRPGWETRSPRRPKGRSGFSSCRLRNTGRGGSACYCGNGCSCAQQGTPAVLSRGALPAGRERTQARPRDVLRGRRLQRLPESGQRARLHSLDLWRVCEVEVTRGHVRNRMCLTVAGPAAQPLSELLTTVSTAIDSDHGGRGEAKSKSGIGASLPPLVPMPTVAPMRPGLSRLALSPDMMMERWPTGRAPCMARSRGEENKNRCDMQSPTRNSIRIFLNRLKHTNLGSYPGRVLTCVE